MSESVNDQAYAHDVPRPAAVLEAAMVALGEEEIEAETLLWVMTAATLLLPEIGDGDDSVALVIEEDDGEFLALFSHLDQVPDMGEFTPEFTAVTGLDALVALPEDTGIAVNPGSDTSFSVDAENLSSFREHLADCGLLGPA